MIKLCIVTALLTLICLEGTSNADILKCTGGRTWNENELGKFMGEILEVQLDIVVPEKKDEKFIPGLLSKDGKFERIENSMLQFRKSTIEITESLGKGETKAIKNQGRYGFIVTRMPSESNSLIGFLIPDGSHVWSIRVDSWKKDKPFYLYRSDWNELVTGNCRDNALE